MKCYKCRSRLYHKYKYCPNCGRLVGMYESKFYAMVLADSAQANRIEKKLDILLENAILNQGGIRIIVKPEQFTEEMLGSEER